MTIDLAAIARDLRTPIEKIEATVQLLDNGNTIPFITRFRKDETSGLNEEQIQEIKNRIARMRAVAERKSFILKSIESQGKLDDQLTAKISAATTSRELEDLYLPFKPKKQSLATVAKQNGLEPLALDIFEGRQPDVDLATRATEFVRVDKGLNSVDDVISGVGHLLAERFSDNGQLRSQLRSVFWQTGKLSTTLIGVEPSEAEEKAVATKRPSPEGESAAPATSTPLETASGSDESQTTASENPEAHTADSSPMPVGATEQTPEQPADQSSSQSSEQVDAVVAQDPAIKGSDDIASIPTTTSSAGNSSAVADTTVTASVKAPRKKTRKKKKKKVDDPYKDYYDFQQPLGKIPYHRSLAINRGERAGRLKVKVQCDEAKLLEVAKQNLVAADHPFANFMDACVKDAITRLIGPSLEREVRRELTEAAERHAVEVFAHNLKNLLLQAPIRNQRVLAIDPGYKRGCSVVCLDSCGKILASDHIFVVGNQQRKTSSKEKLVGLVNQYAIDLLAIGNGAACREAEQIVSDIISESFPNKNLKYAIINEAGASFYSTSEIGREELPDASPAVQSTVSIGRRLIDPLSELVKISPANIGVGLYQHDVKAKHLSESLDEVVQFCVNRVGVNVNTASPSLLRYVSGLNQLTARRVVEYRQEHGAFKNRAQLKEVSGLGETTFIQSAGFLRIRDGDQPLDSTPIHPESYEIVEKIIAKIGGSVGEIFPTAQEFTSSPEPNDPESKSSDCATPTEADSLELESNSVDSSPEDPNTVRMFPTISPPKMRNRNPTRTRMLSLRPTREVQRRLRRPIPPRVSPASRLPNRSTSQRNDCLTCSFSEERNWFPQSENWTQNNWRTKLA